MHRCDPMWIGCSDGSSRQPCRRDHCCRRRHAKRGRNSSRSVGLFRNEGRRCAQCVVIALALGMLLMQCRHPSRQDRRLMPNAAKRFAAVVIATSHIGRHRVVVSSATRRAAGDGQRRGGAASLLDALSGTLVVETTRRAFGEARQEVDIYTPPSRPIRVGRGTPFCSGRSPVRNPEPPTSIATEPPRLANDSWAECGRNGWKRDEEVTALLEANRRLKLIGCVTLSVQHKPR